MLTFYPKGEILCQEVSPTTLADATKVPVSTPPTGLTESSSSLPAVTPVISSSSDPSVLTESTGSDVVDEISKLLASDKVLEEDTGNLEEDNQELESLGIMEPDRVKQEEAALDDKLTVELRSIVDQIQVRPMTSLIYICLVTS